MTDTDPLAVLTPEQREIYEGCLQSRARAELLRLATRVKELESAELTRRELGRQRKEGHE